MIQHRLTNQVITTFTKNEYCYLHNKRVKVANFNHTTILLIGMIFTIVVSIASCLLGYALPVFTTKLFIDPTFSLILKTAKKPHYDSVHLLYIRYTPRARSLSSCSNFSDFNKLLQLVVTCSTTLFSPVFNNRERLERFFGRVENACT